MAKQENENEVLLKQSDHCKGKSYWPELVGVDGEEAKEIIEKENPNVTIVQIFPVGKGLQSADHYCRHLQEKWWTEDPLASPFLVRHSSRAQAQIALQSYNLIWS
ncbi:unnamed protein product [Cuscuta campestris]|uniref:Uncharacterized protein n=1 Tax=Cuscuta campestris TaxID=132261 RepID=A0A484KW21_9ASTE|nr:unnamed protein product [Cuscuta campestris]